MIEISAPYVPPMVQYTLDYYHLVFWRFFIRINKRRYWKWVLTKGHTGCTRWSLTVCIGRLMFLFNCRSLKELIAAYDGS